MSPRLFSHWLVNSFQELCENWFVRLFACLFHKSKRQRSLLMRQHRIQQISHWHVKRPAAGRPLYFLLQQINHSRNTLCLKKCNKHALWKVKVNETWICSTCWRLFNFFSRRKPLIFLLLNKNSLMFVVKKKKDM